MIDSNVYVFILALSHNLVLPFYEKLYFHSFSQLKDVYRTISSQSLFNSPKNSVTNDSMAAGKTLYTEKEHVI